MKERTLSIIKPDGVSMDLIGEVIKRLENAGLKIVAMKMIKMTKDQAKGFYKVHEGKPFYEKLVTYITSGPVVPMVWEGTNAVDFVRKLLGVTDPQEAAPGTVRADFGQEIGRNIIHGSDSPASAEREINLVESQESMESRVKFPDPTLTPEL